MKDSRRALAWIANILSERSIPFAVVGGLAANSYGSTRPLNDIDIDVPDVSLKGLAKELHQYVNFGPVRSVSECFDCELLGLLFEGQEIELSGADSLLIKNPVNQKWNHWPTDLAQIEMREVLGITVPVMGRKQLVAYKEIAARESDILDVEAIKAGK